MRKAEDRAKIIGQHLIDLLPVLKAQGMSLSNYCRDFLPFGKTTAYDYIKIAKGDMTWDALLDRKNSAGAENPSDVVLIEDDAPGLIELEPYSVEECMKALAGMSWLYGQKFEGSAEDAAKVLIDELMNGSDQDSVGDSIAVDRVAWFLKFKGALDLAHPDLEAFVSTEPKLAIAA
jgi:hypothetical protein